MEDDEYSGGETAARDGDWNHVVMMKTNDDATESTDTLVIYTDIEAPEKQADSRVDNR